jgi:[protein-PII] uridylyltransferase
MEEPAKSRSGEQIAVPPGSSYTSEIAAEFLKDCDPYRALEVRTSKVDAIVIATVAEYLAPAMTTPFVVAAVGGYGRRELFPYSDIDLMLAFESEGELSRVKEPLSNLLRNLWDSGLRVSHSVRTIAECSRVNQQNIELHVSLLDRRSLWGNAELYARLSACVAEVHQRQVSAITKRLGELARQRHSKYNNTVYHLEPNVKEAPGGIRDLHLLGWLAQLYPQQEAVRESLEELKAARRFLFALRCFLHFETGRDNNLLAFELQDRAAEALPARPMAPEEWMRTYYRGAREIFQPALRALDYVESQDPSLFRQVRDARSRFSTGDFTVSRDRVFLRNPANTFESTDSIFQLFTYLARHGFRLSWDAHRRIRTSIREIERILEDHPPGRHIWRELLSQPHAGIALHELQETGLLEIVVPEWRKIDSLVVRDFYHRYTVDEHTLVAIQAIDDLLANGEDTPERFHDLLVEDDDPALLRFALLLHDIGKGTNPGNHVRGSVEAAENVMKRLQVPPVKQDDVRFLIEHHLDLSLVMNGRDLEDPATARFLTSRVGTQERLRQLALLTYADISAVNPTAMTPWRLEQLWRVYTLGLEQLTRDLMMDRIRSNRSMEAELASSPEVAAFLEGLPTRYLRTHTREEIDRHYALYRRAIGNGVAAETVKEVGAYVISVVARDHPGLFASLCGALASFGMNIVKAEAFSNAAGNAVDVIRFSDPMRTLELNPGETDRLQWTIECVVRGSIEVRDLLKRRRPMRPVSSGAKISPRVRFNNEASDGSTLMDFVGEDRPGLLYDLASVLSGHGCDIEVVMIDTEGHKALDVFYMTHDGGKLSETIQDELKSEILKVAMGM